MIRKTVAMSLILAAGICAYRGSSPYIEARMEQEYLKQAAFPGNEENYQKRMSVRGMTQPGKKRCLILHRLILKP